MGTSSLDIAMSDQDRRDLGQDSVPRTEPFPEKTDDTEALASSKPKKPKKRVDGIAFAELIVTEQVIKNTDEDRTNTRIHKTGTRAPCCARPSDGPHSRRNSRGFLCICLPATQTPRRISGRSIMHSAPVA